MYVLLILLRTSPSYMLTPVTTIIILCIVSDILLEPMLRRFPASRLPLPLRPLCSAAAKGLAARVGGSAGGTVHSHSTRRINPNRLVPSSVPSPTAYPYYAASRQSLMPGKAARTVATHS